MREPENIRAVASLDIDLMGFIFYPKSSRYVQMISSKAGIIPDYSVERLRGLKARNGENETAKTGDPVDADALPARVGVFVDDMPQNIVTRVYNYSLDYVQLHGDESPVMIENLRRTLDPDIAPRIKIIKALSIRSEEDVRRWRDYKGLVDLFLFDTPTEGYGGSGEKFDWTALEAYDGDVPFLLSGGIGPADAERIKSFQHPQFAGIDLNSQFETAPGMKDLELLRTFIAKIRNEQN
jgi:phosphoribosylanthranilate isomerase